MDEVCTREEVWISNKELSLSMIDSPLPWYPEQVGFSVCEITCGN